MPRRDIIVIGASAGGLSALSTIVRALPEDLPAAVFIIQHMSRGPSRLAELLDKAGPLPVSEAVEGQPFARGHVYTAAPDHHLLLEDTAMRVVYGPRENRSRPAIDPLFRSAAEVFGTRVAGVVLTGHLDDGTAGLLAIKQHGGLALVQDPEDAYEPSMPESALAKVEVDYVLPVGEIGAKLCMIEREQESLEEFAPEARTTNGAAETEGGKTMKREASYIIDKDLQENGSLTPFSCPDCGGPIWEVQDGELHKYQCQIGHAYTEKTMLNGREEAVEEALEVALRTLEERKNMLERLTRDAQTSERNQLAKSYADRAEESGKHADSIRNMLHLGA